MRRFFFLSLITLTSALAAVTNLLPRTSIAQSMEEDSLNDQAEFVLDGFTEPYRDIRVGASDTSAIAEIRVDEGDTVRFGDIIARLDDTIANANVSVARQAAASNGELEAARLQMQTSTRRYETCLELHSRNHATDQELRSIQAEMQQAVARHKAYEELASRRRLELVQSEAQLNRMTVRSPIDGVVVERMKDIGEVVSPADAHLVRIVQLDPLRISTTASIAQAKHLKPGLTLQTVVAGQSAVSIVEFVSPVADASSRTMIVHLRLANPNQGIPAGLSCKISVKTTSADSQTEQDREAPRQTLKSFPFLKKSNR